MERFFTRRVDASSLAAFRIAFGLLMAMESWSLYFKLPIRYAADMYHFTYPGFEWATPLPGYGMHAVFLLMGASAVCIALGWQYRLGAAVYLLTYTYVFLVEQTAYNNHYYFIILLALLFCVTQADAEATLVSSARSTGTIPYWQLFLFRAQVVLVYFFGGVAKVTPDWLQRQPITHWLQSRAESHMLGHILEAPATAYLFAYGGLVFDLSIGFLLLWGRTRLLAVFLVLAFHITNSYVFTIGIFPWLGIGATVLFLEPATMRRVLQRLGLADAPPREAETPASHRWRMAAAFCAVWLAVQIALPLRHWAYPGEVHWTEEGHLLAWHMKLRDKAAAVRFTVEADGQRFAVGPEQLRAELKPKQLHSMGSRPRLTAQYARHLRERYEAKGYADVKVFADAQATLNGRPYQSLVDPNIDLSRVPLHSFYAADWIVPLDPIAQPGEYPPPPAWWHQAQEKGPEE